MTDSIRPSAAIAAETGRERAAGASSAAEPTRQATDRRKVVRRTWILTLIVLVLLAVGAGRTVMSRIDNSKSLETGTAERAKQYVKVTTPKTVEAGQTVALPGTLQGHVQAPIAARASGYLKRWYKDIGARVNKGDLLAEIETPEIDQQLTQAIAAREQAASSLSLAKSTMERWEALRKKDAVSQQELDERRSNDAQARSNVAAADANVQRLRQLTDFKRVVAPFSGVITKRNVDTGDLIDAGGGAGRALFVLAQTDPLRVYISVPQTYAHLVRPGQQVLVSQSELRGQQFKGVVERTAASIDAATRTMQVEISLPNRDGALLPGAFVQVALPLQASQAMMISSNTLMFRGDGLRVATVDAGGKIRLTPVKVGRNYGESVELLEGINAGDRVVLNPSDSLAEGDQVAIAPAAPGAPGAKAAAAVAADAKTGAPDTPGPGTKAGSPATPAPDTKTGSPPARPAPDTKADPSATPPAARKPGPSTTPASGKKDSASIVPSSNVKDGLKLALSLNAKFVRPDTQSPIAPLADAKAASSTAP